MVKKVWCRYKLELLWNSNHSGSSFFWSQPNKPSEKPSNATQFTWEAKQRGSSKIKVVTRRLELVTQESPLSHWCYSTHGRLNSKLSLSHAHMKWSFTSENINYSECNKPKWEQAINMQLWDNLLCVNLWHDPKCSIAVRCKENKSSLQLVLYTL